METVFRPARASDADAAVPLILSSGPAAFSYVFDVPGRGDAGPFLRRAFAHGGGEFGWRNHVVGELDGRVVAAGAAWSGRATPRFTWAALGQVVSHYGVVAGTGVAVRGLSAATSVRAPTPDVWYASQHGVPAELRGRGIGVSLVRYLLELGQSQGYARTELDVAFTNPAAERLYRRLGYEVVAERASSLANDRATVPGHRRMAAAIARVVAVAPDLAH